MLRMVSTGHQNTRWKDRLLPDPPHLRTQNARTREVAPRTGKCTPLAVDFNRKIQGSPVRPTTSARSNDATNSQQSGGHKNVVPVQNQEIPPVEGEGGWLAARALGRTVTCQRWYVWYVAVVCDRGAGDFRASEDAVPSVQCAVYAAHSRWPRRQTGASWVRWGRTSSPVRRPRRP
eukprot:gene18917-biopygen19003